MKYNRTICLEEDIQKQLIGVNASELINTLLFKHFQTNTPTTPHIQKDIDSQIKELKTQKQTIKHQIKKEEVIKSIKLPKPLIEWIKILKSPPTPIQITIKVKSLNIHPTLQLRTQILQSYHDINK